LPPAPLSAGRALVPTGLAGGGGRDRFLAERGLLLQFPEGRLRGGRLHRPRGPGRGRCGGPGLRNRDRFLAERRLLIQFPERILCGPSLFPRELLRGGWRPRRGLHGVVTDLAPIHHQLLQFVFQPLL